MSGEPKGLYDFACKKQYILTDNNIFKAFDLKRVLLSLRGFFG